MRDAGHLAFNELAKERELLLIGHDVWGAANLSLCDEHFQMGHDLVFQLLVLVDRNESDQAHKGDERAKEGGCGGEGGGEFF